MLKPASRRLLCFKSLKNIILKNLQKQRNYSAGVTIELQNAFKMYNLEECPSSKATINKEQASKLYEQMQTIRRMESAIAGLYRDKSIRGFCHLYDGQEAICVGFKSVMSDKDNVITAYRCHGWVYIMGVPILKILLELTGRKNGQQRGKGGSMHMYCPGFYGGNGIVGAQVPLGTGVSLACKYKGNGGVCLALYGDGASNQGQVFESYNMAHLWKLPTIFVCENNLYGMGTQANRSSSNTEYYTRGDVIPGIWVDGMNVLAVRNAAEFAIKYAVKNGPIVMEMHTYRYMGHSMSDPGTSYRKRDEIQEVRKTRDAIAQFRELCIAQKLLTEAEIKAIDEKIQSELKGFLGKIKSEKEIELKELTADVYAKNYEPKIRDKLGYTLDHIQINKGINH